MLEYGKKLLNFKLKATKVTVVNRHAQQLRCSVGGRLR